ncbi:MAG: hypothetical protein LC795_12560 [Acidobacteria bacterium]|nr:hypothetical protein [Acidobacteriota bacterium]
MAREEDEWAGTDGPGRLDAREPEAARPFAPEQMVACEECLRANPPTRPSCLYCGATLPSTPDAAALRRPVLKKLEEWEHGFNVVTLARAAGALTSEAAEEAASLLRLDTGGLKEIVLSGRAMPVARAASADEAWLIVERLRALGLNTEVFPDEVLARGPLRVRALEFEEDALVCRPGPEAELSRVPWCEVVLFVKGRVVSRRVEVAERRRGFSGRSETVETRELASDEAVLDIYTAVGEEHPTSVGAAAGFRVMAGGFDYTCLGGDKRLLAAENFDTLFAALRARAPSAVCDEEYARLRPLLAEVWPSAERTESLGLRRERAGRYNTEAVTTVSNGGQFTRYARLRQMLVLRARAESL